MSLNSCPIASGPLCLKSSKLKNFSVAVTLLLFLLYSVILYCMVRGTSILIILTPDNNASISSLRFAGTPPLDTSSCAPCNTFLPVVTAPGSIPFNMCTKLFAILSPALSVSE